MFMKKTRSSMQFFLRGVEKMVENDLETLNSIFEVLEDWDKVLKADEVYKHPALRGPRP